MPKPLMLLNGVRMLDSSELEFVDNVIEEHTESMRRVANRVEIKLHDFDNYTITLGYMMHGTVVDPYPQYGKIHINREFMEVVG